MDADLRGLVRRASAPFRPWHFMVPDVARGGNFLYFWLWADRMQRSGRDAQVMFRPHMHPWLEAFPALKTLTRDQPSARWPLKVWEQTQRFGVDFSAEDASRFIRERLLTAPEFADRVNAWSSWLGPDAVTINIRRGDYYSVPEYTRRFGFDIPAYVDAACRRLLGNAIPKHVFFVSDDLEWCARVLGPKFQGNILDRPWARDGIFDDFAALAGSKNLVLTNSTFSYWGAYTAHEVQGGDVLVVAPALHERTASRWRATQHFPEWAVVEDPAGGAWFSTGAEEAGTP